MKAFNTILKILAALAAVAGAIYVIATYGDKIVAWAKKVWASLPKADDHTIIFDQPITVTSQDTAGETVEETPEQTEAVPAEAAQIPENEPVADEADFAE